MTTYTDEHLKRALAKMLPDTVGFIGDSTTLLYKPSGAKVLDTELLYLCSLVEETFDINIESADSPRYAYARELYGLCCPAMHPIRAPWQQRVIAAAKVKGVYIV